MRIKSFIHAVATGSGIVLAAAPNQAPAAVSDTTPAFMQILTNQVRVTNAVIVTNYVTITNVSYTTNLFNAQGQFLRELKPLPSGLIPIVPAVATTPAPAPVPDPAVLQAVRATAVKDLMLQSLLTASNKVCAPEFFADSNARPIQMPPGVTSFDTAKGRTLLAAMNTAAAKAAPDACRIIAESANALKPSDPAAILRGPDDAATALLFGAENENLASAVLGVVRRTSSDARVLEAYRSVMLKGGGLLGAVLGTGPTVDMDMHITQSLLATISQATAAQEKLIRKDPKERKTKALQDAMGK